MTKSRLGPWHSQVCMSRSKVYQKCAHTHMLHNYFLQLLQVTSMVICEFRHDQVETRTVTFTSMTSRSKVYQSCAHTHICTCMSWSWLTTRLTVEVRIWTRDQVGAKCASISVHTFVQDQIHKWPWMCHDVCMSRSNFIFDFLPSLFLGEIDSWYPPHEPVFHHFSLPFFYRLSRRCFLQFLTVFTFRHFHFSSLFFIFHLFSSLFVSIYDVLQSFDTSFYNTVFSLQTFTFTQEFNVSSFT